MSSKFTPATTSALMSAIRANNLHALRSAIDAGGNIEEADMHGYPGLPLRTACFSGNLLAVRALLDAGADINAPTADGRGAPLRLALRAGHQDIAALLLSRGAEIPDQVDIPPSLMERAQEMASGERASIDMPALEFERGLAVETSLALPAVPLPSAPGATETQLGNIIDFEFAPLPADVPPAPPPAPATPKPAPLNEIEEVDLKGVYGVDTNIINMDLEHLSGAQPEPAPQLVRK
jgi:hypothetical protein